MKRFMLHLLLALLPATLGFAQTATLTVEGHAALMKPADQFRASFSVVTQAKEATDALADNSKQVKAMQAALEAVGLDKSEQKTGQFSIRPIYTPRPRQNADPNWQPKIIAYQVSNTVDIHTPKLDWAGKLIEAAAKAGADSINGIVFDIKDPRKFRSQAIAAATANAVTDAKSLAQAANVELMRIVEVNLDQAAPTPNPLPKMRGEVALAMDIAPPMTPGDVTIRASVRITYQIRQREGQE